MKRIAIAAAVVCWAPAAAAQTAEAPSPVEAPQSAAPGAKTAPLPLDDLDLPPELREMLRGVKVTPELRESLAKVGQAAAEMTPRALTPTGEPAQIASGAVAVQAPV
ncbi:MAG TPA: hypothetical protein VF686_02815, partial [Brevundimonas sp.]